MPHHKSCIKRMKTSAAARERNKAYRSMIKTAIKRVTQSENRETALENYRKAVSIIDKMSSKGIIHRNNANNKKSRLSKWINQNYSVENT